METLKVVKSTLLKSFIYGYVLLILSNLFYIYKFDFIFNISQKFYHIDKITFTNDVFLMYGLFKILLIVFFLIPGLALWCTLKKSGCCCKTEEKE